MFFKAARPGRNQFYWYFLMLATSFFGGQILGGLLWPIFYKIYGVKPPIADVDMPNLDGLSFTETLNAILGWIGDVSVETMAAFNNLAIPNNTKFVMMMMPFLCSAALFYFLFKFFHDRPIRTVLTGHSKFRWNHFWFAFMVGAVFIIGSTLVGYFLSPESYTIQFDPKKFIPLVILAAIFIPIQSGFEEVLFRGYLMQGLGFLFKSRWAALLFTSLGFGLLHMGNPEVFEHGVVKMLPVYAGMGLLFGVLALLDNGLEIPIGLHIANNFSLALFSTSPESALQTDAIFSSNETMNPSGTLIQLLIMLAFFVGIFAWKYKWPNWKERLTGRVSAQPETQLYS